MEWFISFVEKYGWFGIISSLTTIVSAILAILFYYRGKKEKRPVFNHQTTSIIDPRLTKLRNLEITFGKIPINNLSLMKFAFWNAGKQSILRSDIAPSSPILLRFPESITVYDLEITFQTPANNFSASKIDKHTLRFDFDFMDYNDGFIVKVFHNGKGLIPPTISGTIIGAHPIQCGIKDVEGGQSVITFRPVEYLIRRKSIFIKILGWILVIPGLAISLAFIFLMLPNYFLESRFNKSHRKEFLLKDYSY